MKYGIREVCDVVLKAKSKMNIGNKIFYKDEPVIYFDSLKTSTLEGAATTVYAQGGRGNSRLIAWEGERTVTFTMEDALISTEGLAILTGANLITPSKGSTIPSHKVEITDKITINEDSVVIQLEWTPSNSLIYVMLRDGDRIVSEPYLAQKGENENEIVIKSVTGYTPDLKPFNKYNSVVVDYYVDKGYNQIKQIEITPDSFSGNFYLEASTLFRDSNGVDMPAEFIIPNCKVQSNFTFNLNSSGDPSTFTFTLDAFPDYTRFDRTKKVLSVIQIISEKEENGKPPNRYPGAPNLKPSEGLEYEGMTIDSDPFSDDYIAYQVVGLGDCEDLDVVIPSEYKGLPVASIRQGAFYDCSELTSVIIPNSITEIGDWAFAGCSSLTSVTIPDSVTYITDGAFSHCSSLTSITIPDSVISIGHVAFSNCTGLTSVTIPDNVIAIDESAFQNCTSLTSVTIPDSVTSIGYNAFYGCDGLVKICLRGDETSLNSDEQPWGAENAEICWNCKEGLE